MMDAGTAATVIGPRDGQVTAIAVTGAATGEVPIPYLNDTPLSRFIHLQAIGADVNVVFGVAGMAAPTLTGNSLRVLAVQGQVRWLVPPGTTHIRTIATGAGTLLVAPGTP